MQHGQAMTPSSSKGRLRNREACGNIAYKFTQQSRQFPVGGDV
jgi:hypothetical protein